MNKRIIFLTALLALLITLILFVNYRKTKKELKINIPHQFINSVRIAQIEFFDYDCIKIDDSHAIKKIDDLLFCFPENVECKSAEEILQNKKLSNKKFNLINRLEIDKGIIILISLIFLMVNAGFVLNIVSLKKDIKKLQTQKEEFLSKTNLPQTSFQLDSILNSLKEEFKKQVKIKKDLEIFTKTPLKKGEYFIKLSFDSKQYEVKIKASRNLDFYFRRFFNVTSEYKNGIYKASLK